MLFTLKFVVIHFYLHLAVIQNVIRLWNGQATCQRSSVGLELFENTALLVVWTSVPPPKQSKRMKVAGSSRLVKTSPNSL
jgi:hypothetical protein